MNQKNISRPHLPFNETLKHQANPIYLHSSLRGKMGLHGMKCYGDQHCRRKGRNRKEITMPIFEYLCLDCGQSNEALIIGSADQPQCRACGSINLQKLVSAHAPISGVDKTRLPGSGDTSCCGTDPGHGDCVGPGSCCGKN